MNEPTATAGLNAATEAAGDILIARDLCKTYTIGPTRLEVLKGIQLSVPRGSVMAIVGASGAGKSTLMHILGGLDNATNGSVSIDGVSLFDLPAWHLSRFRNRQVGFVFQAYQLLPDLEAVENVALPARIGRRPLAEAMRRAQELLDAVGLGERIHHRPAELSGGEQQRVAIARALVNDPPLLFTDEPTGNLDSANGEAVMELLLRLQRERGMTLMIVTHDAGIARHCGRVLEMCDGVIVGQMKA